MVKRTGRPKADNPLKRDNKEDDFLSVGFSSHIDSEEADEVNEFSEEEYYKKLKEAEAEFADVESAEDIREAYRKILTRNIAHIGVWIEMVGHKNPARALMIFKEMSEFVVPKLQRTDSALDSTNPVNVYFETVDAMKARYAKKNEKKPPPIPIHAPITPRNAADDFLD